MEAPRKESTCKETNQSNFYDSTSSNDEQQTMKDKNRNDYNYTLKNKLNST